ncbi:MAG: SWIM zinc finger domain-containing protein [Acutalibacteraceae bacterium]
MKFKIGFATENEETRLPEEHAPEVEAAAPRKSVVRVQFFERPITCSYYNDMFDLHKGDIVYVEGKLEGMRGVVVEVSYTFKIKLSDYKRVIAKADTDITGTLYMAGSHFAAFDRSVLPYEKVLSWFKAPENPEDEYVSGSDGTAFCLENLNGMKVSPEIAERGEQYYLNNKVVYLSVDGERGRAIVFGSKAYEIEFNYIGGEVSGLVCGCYCSGVCKHAFAAMLQLRETLKIIDENYQQQYHNSGYFAAVSKSALFSIAIDSKSNGCFTLG